MKGIVMAKRIGAREVRVVFETDAGNYARSGEYIVDRIYWGLKQVNNAVIAFAVYDENGRRLDKVELLEPSAAMQKVMDDEMPPGEVVA
jgi:hypothetical protein